MFSYAAHLKETHTVTIVEIVQVRDFDILTRIFWDFVLSCLDKFKQ